MPFDFKRLKHLKEIQPFISCFIRGRSASQQGMKQPKKITLPDTVKPKGQIIKRNRMYSSSDEESEEYTWSDDY